MANYFKKYIRKICSKINHKIEKKKKLIMHLKLTNSSLSVKTQDNK